MNIIGWIFGIMGLVVWLACRSLPKKSSGRYNLSDEDMEEALRYQIYKDISED